MRHAYSIWFLIACICSANLFAQKPPLHTEIDKIILDESVGPVAAVVDDAKFIRRLSLDLFGRIPTRSELDQFVADQSPNKREHFVDQYLNDAECHDYLSVVLDVMLMERRGNKHVKSDEFRVYLKKAIEQDKPLNVLASEILAADGTDERIRPAAAFYLERDVEPHLLTRDTGRIFFGVDLQCAQCHNHPLIDDYLQQDYYGLHAFYVRSKLFQPDKKKPALIAESATGEANFKSVFTDREGVIGGRVPGGTELAEVSLKPGDQYSVMPAKNVRQIPRLSRLSMLSENIAKSPSPAFARNFANRIWAMMMKRGVVEPVDVHHSDNPPVSPKLMALLSKSFADGGYRIKPLLREIAFSNAYQRSHILPSLQPDLEQARMKAEELKKHQEKLATELAGEQKQIDATIEGFDKAVAAAKPIRAEVQASFKKVEAALTARTTAEAKRNAVQKQHDEQQAKLKLLRDAQAKTKAAVDGIKDDKDLAAALVTINNRTDAASKAAAQTEEQLKKEQAAFATAENTLKAAQVAADAVIAALKPHDDKIRTLRNQLFDSRAKVSSVREQVNIAKAKVSALESLLVFDMLKVKMSVENEKRSSVEKLLQEKTNLLTKLIVDLKKQQTEADVANKYVTQQQQVVTSSRAKLKTISDTASKLQKSLGEANAALKTLGADEQLQQAIKLISESKQRVEQQSGEAQKLVMANEAMLKLLTETATSVNQAHEKSKQIVASVEKQLTAAKSQVATSIQAIESLRSQIDSQWKSIVDDSSRRFASADLTHLSPEQLGWSLMIATGVYDRQVTAELAKINKAQPLPKESANDTQLIAQRQKQAHQNAKAALLGSLKSFISLYGLSPGEPQNEFFATTEQSLFVANGSVIQSWLNPSSGNLTDRLAKEQDHTVLATDLYKSVLCRRPTETEVREVGEYLKRRGEAKSQAVQELAWGLISSAEFRFRH